jgi:branched-chain amino acid transport system substrate-binding protein
MRSTAFASGTLCVQLALASGCRAPEPAAVIGYAYRAEISASADVAMEAIRRTDSAGGPRIVIRGDSTIVGENPDSEVRRAEALAAIPGIVAVVGHGGSRGSLAAAPIYNAEGIPHITPTSTSRRLRDIGEWTFMLAPDDSVEGEFIVDFAVERLGARSVTIFNVTDEYGSGLRDGVEGALARRGVRLVDQVAYEPGSDFDVLVRATLARGRPDVVVVAGRQDETAAITGLLRRHAPGVRVIAGDGGLVAPMPPTADSMYVVVFWLPDPADSASQRFIREFRRVTGRDPGSTEALTHDALMLAASAAREAGANRAAIREWLAGLGRSRPAWRGVTGLISFTPDRREHLVMARVHDGLPVKLPPP